MKAIFLLVGIAFASQVWASAQDDAAELLQRFSGVSGIASRIDAYTKSFLGLPYGVGGPLGEGPQGRYDQDPLYRFDTFDCTTFVETVVALAHSTEVQDFESRMDEIRYENGVIDYVTRNHFPSLQWIPNNIHNGYFRDVTRQLAPTQAISIASALIDLPRHYSFMKADMLRVANLTPAEREVRAQEWRDEGLRLTAQQASLAYVSINWILQNPQWLQRIPHGTIINFVRPNWDLTATAGTHMNVSHQGFVIRHGNQVLLRHAASSGNKRVSEVPFLEYLKPFVNHPTLKGIHLLAVE